MIAMKYGDTTIRVQPEKVDEMLRKDWELVESQGEPVKAKKARAKKPEAEPEAEVTNDQDSGEE